MLNVGDTVKDFSLKDAFKEDVWLSKIAKKYTVIFFYPKNHTISCTKEACSFNDLKREFDLLNVTIIGISVDSPSSHLKFKKQYGLDIILLSDLNRVVSNYFGVINSESKTNRAKRITFILDSNLEVIYRFDHVKPASHGRDVLKLIKEAF